MAMSDRKVELENNFLSLRCTDQKQKLCSNQKLSIPPKMVCKQKFLVSLIKIVELNLL